MSSKKQLTFKQYLSSKEKLREAIKNTPKQTIQYTVNKYYKLVVGESKDKKDYVSFKPKHKINVEWLYENIDDPTPLKINISKDDSNDEYVTFWSGQKLSKWLLRNTSEEIQY